MKAWIAVALVVLIAALCLGMSSMGSKEENHFPRPGKNFKATITDTDNVKSKADLVACEGMTKLSAYRGTAHLLVPFSKIQRIVFADLDNRFRSVQVTFWNGSTHDLQAKKFMVCTGRTELGEMFVKVQNIREVEFEKGQYASTDDDEPVEQATPEPGK